MKLTKTSSILKCYKLICIYGTYPFTKKSLKSEKNKL